VLPFKLLRQLLFCLGLGMTAGLGSAWAACMAPAQGVLAPLEALAFRAPAQALAQLEKLGALAATQAPVERAQAMAMAAEAARQLGQGPVFMAHANAGLAALAPVRDSDLALRLRAVHAIGQDDAAVGLAEFDAALLVAADRPLVRGCLLRDRGWTRLSTNDLEGALRDLIEAHALLAPHLQRDEQMVATGRLGVAYVNAGDHTSALALVAETEAHFRSTQAPVRLVTALGRKAYSLSMLKRLPEAEAALREALAISRQNGDSGGAEQTLISLCQAVGRQDREAEALALCAEAERAMVGSASADDDSLHQLALLRVEVLRSRAPNAQEMAKLQEVLRAWEGANERELARVYLARARALAARGDFEAAHQDTMKVLSLQRAATESERIKSQAAMRVRFETDRALARGAALAEQNKIGKERLLWVALAALASLAAAGGLGYSLLLNRRHQLRLTQVAERDDLTGLPNRRKIMEDAEQQFALARRRGSALVIGMCDIDHFKRINDQHGHAGGDRVLAAFGKTARPALRSTDSLGRWGGEEFLLVLPDCALPDGAAVAERMRVLLGAHAAQDDTGQELRFTVSIGLAMATPEDDSLQAVLQRADAALYAAKAQGRDRVVLDGKAARTAPAGPARAAPPQAPGVPVQRRRGERRQRTSA
jgi:diguanylate cyclase (GGDEF)-like protein